MPSPSSSAMSEIYEQLTAPFAHTFKKPGSNLDYITGEQVTSRLNEVIGWDGWTFRVLEHGYDESADELWCLGELTIGSTIRNQFGSQKPNRYSSGKNEGKIIDLGFDLKGAATDALKKCASLIGVGLYLHEKESAHREAPRQAPPTSIAPAEASPGRTYDAEELLSLMGQFGVTKEMLIKITGVSTNGNPQISRWLSLNQGKTVSDLISRAADLKSAAVGVT